MSFFSRTPEDAEPVKKRGFFLSFWRLIRFVLLIDFVIYVFTCFFGIGKLTKQKGGKVVKNVQSYAANKELAACMNYAQFLEHHGLVYYDDYDQKNDEEQKKMLGKKKKYLVIEMLVLVPILIWELVVVLNSTSQMVTIQAVLVLFILLCLFYLRGWFLYVLCMERYIPLRAWIADAYSKSNESGADAGAE